MIGASVRFKPLGQHDKVNACSNICRGRLYSQVRCLQPTVSQHITKINRELALVYEFANLRNCKNSPTFSSNKNCRKFGETRKEQLRSVFDYAYQKYILATAGHTHHACLLCRNERVIVQSCKNILHVIRTPKLCDVSCRSAVFCRERLFSKYNFF